MGKPARVFALSYGRWAGWAGRHYRPLIPAVHGNGGNAVLAGTLPREPETGTADVCFGAVLSSRVEYGNFTFVGVQD